MANYTAVYGTSESSLTGYNCVYTLTHSNETLNALIKSNIPSYSRINSAVWHLQCKRDGGSSSIYHTDYEWQVRNIDNETLKTLSSANGAITTSYKTFSQDITSYFFSETANAGKINPDLAYKFVFRASGTLSRTYTTTNRRVEYSFEKPKVTLNTSKNIDGGLITGSQTHEVEVNDYTVTLTATPNDGFIFSHWLVDGKEYPTENVSVEISQNNISAYETIINAVAFFEAKTISVTTSASPSEGGTVTGGGVYERGSTVTATATPNDGYDFSYWLINGVNFGSDNPISGALTEDTTVTAVFEKISQPEISSVQITPNPCEAGQGFIISVGFTE